jgi:selenocysteine lyase/cysteine desulfurase
MMKEIQSISVSDEARSELEKSVYTLLETYSNVHRGSGHNSMVTSRMYDQAREIVLDYLQLPGEKYVAIFCSPRRAEFLTKGIDTGKYRIISSSDIGLPLGVRAIAIVKSELPGRIPFHSGGGTARLVSPDWIIWAKAPERFEPGTPAIVNIIMFVRALILLKKSGLTSFITGNNKELNADQILGYDELNVYDGSELLNNLRKTLIGYGLIVPTTEGEKNYINLDNGASTLTFIPVLDAVRKTLSQGSDVQKEIIKNVRSEISEFTGAPLSEYEVIFTSNTTEAVNLAAESLATDPEDDTVVLNTILEHNSNDLPWRSSHKIRLIRIKADKNGFIDLHELEDRLLAYNEKSGNVSGKIKLVTISGASNVLGTFNNLEVIAGIVHKYGARILVDAAQLVAHRKIDMKGCGIDYLAFSAHKVYAPFGTGVLVVRKGLLRFSQQEIEQINLSGEENAAGIAGLGKSLRLLHRIGIDLIRGEENRLTGYALRRLTEIKGINVYGIKDPQSPDFTFRGGVISFSLGNKIAHNVAKILAERGGIGVRSGCHCAHMLVKYLVGVPPLLEKFQGFLLRLFPKLSLPGIVRISFGIENSERDIDALAEELQRIATK